ncbi:hypothetical protein F7734_36380 [Scytonema sp. UIC 10036]|uniref:hypothetical protein n=1 Tax=Scytonema sp. UIC 10036 TaxID=2304196 RepID=UPI0012DA4550|nr:hypothetical protein [Scytonema sp. UIC 10036]MUG97509.1 hypothetical protein [Scytonema sp. UIC 10036]
MEATTTTSLFSTLSKEESAVVSGGKYKWKPLKDGSIVILDAFDNPLIEFNPLQWS